MQSKEILYNWTVVPDHQARALFSLNPSSGRLVVQNNNSVAPLRNLDIFRFCMGMRVKYWRYTHHMQLDTKWRTKALSEIASVPVHLNKPLYWHTVTTNSPLCELSLATQALHKCEYKVISVKDPSEMAKYFDRTEQKCLEYSVNQFLLLTANNIKCAIVIGAHIPTPNLHAWITYDGNAPFERIEKLKYYTPLLRIYMDA